MAERRTSFKYGGKFSFEDFDKIDWREFLEKNKRDYDQRYEFNHCSDAFRYAMYTHNNVIKNRWTQSNPAFKDPKIESKFQKVISMIGDPAIKVTTWYNCYINGRETFGFAVNSSGYISIFPDRNFVGNKITDHRNWFVERKAEVVKICEQIEK